MRVCRSQGCTPSLLQEACQDDTKGRELSPHVSRNFEGEVHKGQAHPHPPSER